MNNVATTIWEKFYQTIKKFPRDEQAELALAMLDYAFTGEHDELSLYQDIALTPMKPSLNTKSLGGAPKGNKNATKLTDKNNTKQPLKTTVEQRLKKKSKQQHNITRHNKTITTTFTNVKDSSAQKRFAPPSVEQVEEYAKDKNYTMDAEHFVAFYSSKGWRVGNQSMKCWKSAIVNWNKRNKPWDKQRPGNDDETVFRL